MTDPPVALSITSAPEIREAIRYAHSQGVASSPRRATSASGDVPFARARPRLIYVGGTTERGCLGDYSNYGPGLDVVAPGGGADADLPGDPSCRSTCRRAATSPRSRSAARPPRRFLVPLDNYLRGPRWPPPM